LTSDTKRSSVDIRHQTTPAFGELRLDRSFRSPSVMTQHSSIDLLQGTLDLLILRTLQAEPMHGWAISDRIQQISQDILQVGQGSLYPALQRLEQQGWLESEWQSTEQNRPAKYYTLTASGRRALTAETRSWRDYVRAVDLILEGN